MPMNSLKDVYLDQLKDLYSADKQSLEVTRSLASAADDPELTDALEAGIAGIQDGMETLAAILEDHGKGTGGEHCKGMEGLVAEARAHALEDSFDDPAVRDAMIITQYQRMAHYGIAGYGCLVAFARRLDLDEDARRLQDCLDACYDGDRRMTDLATDGVNARAAE